MDERLFLIDLQMFAEEDGGSDPTPTDPVAQVNDSEPDYEEPAHQEPPTDPVEPEEMIPKSKVSEIVSKRVNEINDKYKDADKYKSRMDKLLKLSGLTEEQFEQQLQQIELQNSATSMGVSPEIAKQIQESQLAAQQAKDQADAMKYQYEEIQLQQNPLYEGYEEVKDEVREFAAKTGVTLEQGYWALHGTTLAQKQAKQAKDTTVANQRYRKDRGGVESEGGGTVPETPGASLNKAQVRMAKKIGMSPDEYALWSSEDMTYDKSRKITEGGNKA